MHRGGAATAGGQGRPLGRWRLEDLACNEVGYVIAVEAAELIAVRAANVIAEEAAKRIALTGRTMHSSTARRRPN